MKDKGIKVTVQKYPPPLPLAWAFWPAGDNQVTRLHKVHFRAIWRSRSLLGVGEMVLLLLLWPVLLAPHIYRATRRNGRMIKDRVGKGRLRQMWEQFLLAAWFGFRPSYYYTMEFFLPARFRLAGGYVHRYATKDSLFRMLLPDDISPLTDKIGFARRCQERGLPVSPIIASLAKGRVEDDAFAGLPAKDLFVKRTRGRGGSGAELWVYDNGTYRSRSGQCLDGDALIARLRELSRGDPYMIQERHVNHPDIADLAAGALATVRLVTAINERGEVEAIRAAFRMASRADSVVDNFHAGGIAAPVDLVTGTLGRATDRGLAPSVGWVDVHPVTGARITGRRLPQWEAMVALAQQAHANFASRAIVGWDLALTQDGLIIVEGNAATDVDIIQRAHCAPLSQSRFAELMNWHLNNRRQRPVYADSPSS